VGSGGKGAWLLGWGKVGAVVDVDAAAEDLARRAEASWVSIAAMTFSNESRDMSGSPSALGAEGAAVLGASSVTDRVSA
jgi:hypothetical protein